MTVSNDFDLIQRRSHTQVTVLEIILHFKETGTSHDIIEGSHESIMSDNLFYHSEES